MVNTMARPRSEQVCLSVTPFLHLVNRVVRRAWLAGVDPLTKKDFSHRRKWIEDRILKLSTTFTIDIVSKKIIATVESRWVSHRQILNKAFK